jgi:tetratricopeptide (TPR) repeat protein
MESVFLVNRSLNNRMAEDLLKRATEIDPKNVKAFGYLGWEYYNQLRFELSREAYIKALALDQTDEFSLRWLPWAYLGLKRYDEARMLADRYLKLYPKDFKMYELLGRVDYEQENFNKAEGYLHQSVLYMNGAASGCPFQALGVLYSKINITDQSVEYFKKAADKEYNRHKSQFDAALVCFDAADYDCALEYCVRAITIANFSNYYEMKSLIYIMRSDFILAQETLKGLPENSRTLTELGHIMVAEKNYTGAESLFKKAITLNSFSSANDQPEEAMRYYNIALLGLGWVNANQNRHGEALQYYEIILNNSPKNFLALVSKGNSLTGLKKYDEAARVFEFANMLYPDSEYVKAELGLLYYYQGNFTEAENYFNASLKNNNKTYTCPYEGLGLVYYSQGKYAEAKENLEKSININPDIEYKKYNTLAKIYIREGRIEEARILLNKSIDNFPYDGEAKLLLEAMNNEAN